MHKRITARHLSIPYFPILPLRKETDYSCIEVE